MSNFVRIAWLFVLVSFVSGCATYKGAYLPGQVDTTRSGQGSGVVVKEGMAIRVTLIDGEEISGDVVRVSELEIVVEKIGNYGLERRIISSSDIRVIEVENYTRTEETIAKTMAIVIGVAVIGLVVLAYSLRGLGDMN